MSEIIFILICICWYLLSLYLSEVKIKKNQLNSEMVFFISMVLSPFAGFIYIRIRAQKQNQADEIVKQEA